MIVNGLLSYDGDVGLGSYIEFSFVWFCFVLGENVSNDCFGFFVG